MMDIGRSDSITHFQRIELIKSLFGDLVNPNKLVLYGTETLKFMEGYKI